MFAIYNKGSVGFRSTADNLYSLNNIENIQASRLKPDEGTIQNFDNLLNKEEKETNKNALNAYKKMANIDTSEIVYQVKDIMTKDCIYIDEKSTIQDAYNVLREFKIGLIPVVSFGKKIIGTIDKKIILNLLMDDLENTKNVLERRIEDIYLPQIITSNPLTDIRRVAKVMIDFKLHAIPIVDENDILIGIVSKTDIIKAVSHIPQFQLWS
ncbi:CBS domain-containing protein [Arcobacter suis]|uniref:CBS domain-containing protein n=1 Tax=Arcobacter suis CECT 7833 TaxID=663365 RepID=A0AAD0SPV4_9BACT|nr:CBS domain-containing protein [Arcobacter suis]AXX89212.1 CBS domain-containing protein [Arcobacter suis CECT 7833]RWS47787.1 CBS domain-containing protein [Arcobacter suis]